MKVSKKTKDMVQRLFLRSLILLTMAFTGFMLMDLIVEYARVNHGDFVSRFPEVMMILRALTILTWIEISIMWVRVTLQPKVDVQELACMAIESNDARAAAFIYAINAAIMVSRIVLVLHLAELV